MDRLKLNNEVILMRKSLKSVYNQTKLNLSRKISKLMKNEKLKSSAHRKENELEALKRLKLTDIKLHDAIDDGKLKKILTDPTSSEIDRAQARILLNPIIQKNIQTWKSKFGPETVETFLTNNHENIQRGKEKKIIMKRRKEKKKQKLEKKLETKSEEESDDEKSEAESIKSEHNEDDSSEEVQKDEDPKPVVKVPQKRKPEKKQGSNKNVKTFKTPKVVQTSDPFFVDSKGENYVASVSAALSENESSSDDDQSNYSRGKKLTQKLQKIMNKKPIRSKKFDETPPKRMRNEKNERNFEPKVKLSKPDPTIKPIITHNDDNMHPSWKAKAEMKKQQMAGFQGTKIKFDD